MAFGLAMLPFGLGAPVAVSLVSFALAGLSWAPYMSTSMALFQRSTSTANLPRVLAANGAVFVLAGPIGTVLGGPAVTAIGSRGRCWRVPSGPSSWACSRRESFWWLDSKARVNGYH